MSRRTISFAVDPEEYEEIRLYARAKGHGGRSPAAVFAHYALFQQMKKYPLSEAERAKYENAENGALAVQPEGSTGKNKKRREGKNDRN